MASALSNSCRTALLPPVEYPGLSSLTTWSDAAAAAAVGYNYPSCTGPSSAAAHQLVYGAGCRLSTAAPLNPYSAGGGTLGAVPDAWGRHHPAASHSPLSFYTYHHQTETDWILRQSSKLESAFSPHHHHQQQQQQQGWKDGAARREVTATSTTKPANPLSSKTIDYTNK